VAPTERMTPSAIGPQRHADSMRESFGAAGRLERSWSSVLFFAFERGGDGKVSHDSRICCAERL
jgi:hypothetical protein